MSPPTTDPPERSGSVGRTRFGLSLEPSPELHEMITSFLRPAALKRKIGLSVIRLNVAQKPIDIVSGTENQNKELIAAINRYSRSISNYERGRQLRLMADGFEYSQIRDIRGAFTAFTFQVFTSQAVRTDIMQPPFFSANNNAPLRARVVFPSDQVVPYADRQAQAVESAMQAEHPTAIDGLASFAFYLTGLRVSERNIVPPPVLRIVEDEG